MRPPTSKLLFRISSPANIATRFASSLQYGRALVGGCFGGCASELRRRCDLELRDLSASVTDFVEAARGRRLASADSTASLIGSHSADDTAQKACILSPRVEVTDAGAR